MFHQAGTSAACIDSGSQLPAGPGPVSPEPFYRAGVDVRGLPDTGETSDGQLPHIHRQPAGRHRRHFPGGSTHWRKRFAVGRRKSAGPESIARRACPRRHIGWRRDHRRGHNQYPLTRIPTICFSGMAAWVPGRWWFRSVWPAPPTTCPTHSKLSNC